MKLVQIGTVSLVMLGVAMANDSMATHFDGIGSPFGGCGLPESKVDYPHYLALNVQNTPNDYYTYL